MKSHRVLPWLPALLVLAGCTEEPEPGPGPEEAKLNEVVVTCAPSALVLGQQAQCSASAKNQKGEPFTVPGFTWTSSDAALAQVDASGKVTARSAGTVSIRASATSGDITRQGEASLSLSARPPTVHDAPLTTAQTWSLADSPHEVRGQLPVSNGATLTLEPGVVVRFAQDSELRFTKGALVAPGTQAAPIQLLGLDVAAQGSWRGLVFATEGSASRLEHVALGGCGATSGEGACLAVRAKAAPVLVDVAVDKSGSVGVSVADDGSAFGPGSARLSVSGAKGFALSVAANQASSLPTGGSFSANGRDAVLLVGGVSRTQSWPNPGAPFVVNHRLRVEASADYSDSLTLTLAPGSTFRFGPEGELALAYESYAELVAKGTAAAPFLFTSDSASPQPGQWRGLHLGAGISAATHLAHTTVEYAGASGSLIGGSANLNIYGDYGRCGPCPVLQDVTARNGSGVGLSMPDSSLLDATSTRLTVTGNGSYGVSLDPNAASTLPANGTYSGNASNGVLLLPQGPASIRTQTWPKLDAPYVVDGVLKVGAGDQPTPPVLTLLPGTEVRFTANSSLVVGLDANGPGVLIAEGTASAPIQFIPDVQAPRRGHWSGLQLFAAGGTRLDHVVVSYGGAPGYIGTSNISVYKNPAPSITNSRIEWAAGCSIVTSSKSRPNTDVVTTNYALPEYGNAFSNNSNNNPCSY